MIKNYSRIIKHQYSKLKTTKTNNRKRLTPYINKYLFQNVKNETSTFAMRQILAQYNKLNTASVKTKKQGKKDITLSPCTQAFQKTIRLPYAHILHQHHLPPPGEPPADHHPLQLNQIHQHQRFKTRRPLNKINRFISNVQDPTIVKNPDRPSLKNTSTRRNPSD